MRVRTVSLLLVVPFALAPVLAQAPERLPPLPATQRDENDLPDLARYAPMQRVVYLSARRGAEWLWQANRPDGLFVPGQLPAVNLTLDEDDCVHQAGATLALARAARFMHNERYGVRTRQAVLTLLASTALEAEDNTARVLATVTSPYQRLVGGALIVLAIHELPAPGHDLLDQAEQVCNFLRKQQLASGGLGEDKDADDDLRMMTPLALCAVARSQKLSPAEWKAAFVAKGVDYWRSAWKENEPATSYVAWAAGEVACSTRDKAYADFTFQLCEWMRKQQHGLEPRHPLWQGGFKQPHGTGAPGVTGAAYLAGLASWCRTARAFNQAISEAAYRDVIERQLQFLTTLQYLPTNTKHLADWYRPGLYGAFHATHQDGTVRIEYNQVAVMGMLDYLEYVAPVPKP